MADRPVGARLLSVETPSGTDLEYAAALPPAPGVTAGGGSRLGSTGAPWWATAAHS